MRGSLGRNKAYHDCDPTAVNTVQAVLCTSAMTGGHAWTCKYVCNRVKQLEVFLAAAEFILPKESYDHIRTTLKATNSQIQRDFLKYGFTEVTR